MWRMDSSWRPGSFKASQPVGKWDPLQEIYCGILSGHCCKENTDAAVVFSPQCYDTAAPEDRQVSFFNLFLKCQLWDISHFCAELLNLSVYLYFPPVNTTALVAISTLLSDALCNLPLSCSTSLSPMATSRWTPPSCRRCGTSSRPAPQATWL